MSDVEAEIPRLSYSIAKVLLDKSPLHAWQKHRLLGGGDEKKSSKAMDRGKLIEFTMGLSGTDSEDEARIVELPFENFRTKEAQQARDAVEADGGTPILSKDLEEARLISPQILARLEAKGIHLGGTSQVKLLWNSLNPEGLGLTNGKGVACSGVLDRLEFTPQGTCIIRDLKVVGDASPRFMQRQVVNMGWDVQGASYMEAVSALYPDFAGRITYQLLAIEPFKPFAVVPYEFAGSMRELGERKWRRAVETWGRCLATNRWPDYSAGVCRLDATAWQMDQEAGVGLPLEAGND